MTFTRRACRVLTLANLAVATVASAQGAKPRVAPKDTTKTVQGAAGVLLRESYAYSPAGRRDPFVSLMMSAELRPLLADLTLIGVIYDAASPRRSIGMLIDGSSGKSHRATVGAMLGRMKVVKIGPQDITFSIEEFGFSRQEVLTIDTTSKKDASTGKASQQRKSP